MVILVDPATNGDKTDYLVGLRILFRDQVSTCSMNTQPARLAFDRSGPLSF
jgi:hypothetical protein